MRRPAGTDLRRAGPWGASPRRRLILGAYAVWVALVLLATAPYLADSGVRTALGGGEFEYNPKFTHDGEIEHYIVERADPGKDAHIELKVHLDERSVEIEAMNIRNLTVDCNSIATEKNMEIMEQEYGGDDVYKSFFVDLRYLHVHTKTTDPMGITWLHMPRPTAVVADERPYEEDYQDSEDSIIVSAPQGTHHYILFFTDPPGFPEARIEVDRTETVAGGVVNFDGSGSVGGGEPLTDWLWDFDVEGDEVTVDATGARVNHTFAEEGTYRVSLTVRNGMLLEDTAYVTIRVSSAETEADLDLDGVPDWLDDDIDGDGFLNLKELEYDSDPRDRTSTPPDMDGDLIPDPEDEDRDGDGRKNSKDAYPDDGTRWEKPDEGGRSFSNNVFVLALVLVSVIIAVAVVLLLVVRRKKRVQRWDDDAQEETRARTGKRRPSQEPTLCSGCRAVVRGDMEVCPECGEDLERSEGKALHIDHGGADGSPGAAPRSRTSKAVKKARTAGRPLPGVDVRAGSDGGKEGSRPDGGGEKENLAGRKTSLKGETERRGRKLKLRSRTVREPPIEGFKREQGRGTSASLSIPESMLKAMAAKHRSLKDESERYEWDKENE